MQIIPIAGFYVSSSTLLYKEKDIITNRPPPDPFSNRDNPRNLVWVSNPIHALTN